MAPFFVGVYYLINESSRPSYDILVLNQDKGYISERQKINHGDEFIGFAHSQFLATNNIPLQISSLKDQDSAFNILKKKKADVLIFIPEGFSDSLMLGLTQHKPVPPQIEFTGDMTDYNYIIAAIWGSEYLRMYIENISGFPSPFILKETHHGSSNEFDDFDLYMPGLLVLSIIMLMFSASIAFVTEIENGTILRYRLSGLTTIEFIGGVTFIQIIIGILSLMLTLGFAQLLGFQHSGSLWLVFLVVFLVALSIIGFSVILAALTKSSNEILVIGNFPLFLFMFFTGAVFPMEGKAIFSLADYPMNLQGLMSPTHAVSALKKVMLMNQGIADITPELISLVFLLLFYFIFGIWLFKRRHMRFGG
jgi:ABC-2 type transport system permease protein